MYAILTKRTAFLLPRWIYVVGFGFFLWVLWGFGSDKPSDMQVVGGYWFFSRKAMATL